MARIEIDGIYKHAPLTDAQLNSVTRRNLDREIVIKRDAVTDRATLIPNVTTPSTDAGAYPTNYIYAMNYDTTDDGGVNPNIRRHIPTLEFLGNSAVNTAGSNWINIETGTYNYVSSGATFQTALEELDSQLASNTLKYIIDGSTTGSLVSSTDGTTPESINVGDSYQIALGRNQYITSSFASSILGGDRHYIYAKESGIVGGLNNRLMNTAQYSLIGGGVGNLINGAGGSGFSIQFDVASLTQSGGTATLITYAKHGYTGSITASVINVNEPDYAVSGVTMTVIDEYTVTFSISPSAPASATTTSSWNSYGIQLLINTGDGGAFAFIGSGVNNYILSCAASVIVGGSTNVISANESFIGSGYSNTIYHGSDYSSIVGGYNNTIRDGSMYSAILGGHLNYIDSGSYSAIAGGYLNTIDAGSEYAFIGGGRQNTLTHSADYCSISGGQLNIITNGTTHAFIGGGYNNTITNSATYSAILGGHGNYLDATSYGDNSFIIGSLINTTSYQRDNTTYLNNMFLWDRGLELKDKTANVGDVLIVESINNGMPIVTWGSVSGGGSYSGTDPIPGSTGSYTATSKGSSILLSSYIVVRDAENISGNTDGMVGTTFDASGYNFTNVTANTYATIMSDMIGASSPGLEIEDGYRYQIDIDAIAITWGGYLSVNRPRVTLIYTPPIIFSTTDYIFGPNVGTIAGNVTISDETNANYQFTTTDSTAPTTSGPYLMLTYNSTQKKINFILKDVYASSRYVYKMPAVYNSLDGGSTMDITWDTTKYPIPTTSDLITFWQSDPATNGGNPGISIASVAGNIVTINANYSIQVNQPCWVFVRGRMPTVSVRLNYTVTKTAI